jgi:hypothetical protein
MGLSLEQFRPSGNPGRRFARRLGSVSCAEVTGRWRAATLLKGDQLQPLPTWQGTWPPNRSVSKLPLRRIDVDLDARLARVSRQLTQAPRQVSRSGHPRLMRAGGSSRYRRCSFRGCAATWLVSSPRVIVTRSLGVMELLYDVALERFTERFCNTQQRVVHVVVAAQSSAGDGRATYATPLAQWVRFGPSPYLHVSRRRT